LFLLVNQPSTAPASSIQQHRPFAIGHRHHGPRSAFGYRLSKIGYSRSAVTGLGLQFAPANSSDWGIKLAGVGIRVSWEEAKDLPRQRPTGRPSGCERANCSTTQFAKRSRRAKHDISKARPIFIFEKYVKTKNRPLSISEEVPGVTRRKRLNKKVLGTI